MAGSGLVVPKVVSALSARTQFGQIMRRASGKKQERFVVGRRGEPKVVIMGIEDFLRTVAPEPEIMAAIRAEAAKNRTNRLTTRSIGREVTAFRREQTGKNARTGRRS